MLLYDIREVLGLTYAPYDIPARPTPIPGSDLVRTFDGRILSHTSARRERNDILRQQARNLYYASDRSGPVVGLGLLVLAGGGGADITPVMKMASAVIGIGISITATHFKNRNEQAAASLESLVE